MANTLKHTISLTVEVPAQVLQDTLAAGLDAGVAYWAAVGDRSDADDPEFPYYLSELPMAGGWFQLRNRAEERQPRVLNEQTIREGAIVMAQKYPQHFAAMIGEDGDATTGDVLIQCACFGEIVYG